MLVRAARRWGRRENVLAIMGGRVDLRWVSAAWNSCGDVRNESMSGLRGKDVRLRLCACRFRV